MPTRPTHGLLRHLFIPAAMLALTFFNSGAAQASELRRTPIVRAVQAAAPSVVNIHGHKFVDEDGVASATGTKRVNGMGTGVVIDQRGYIITNHHVIEGVRRIQVTLGDGRTQIARLVARDPHTDLAIIKIKTNEPLPLLKIGTSSDLMTGEPVIAVGNAYGYHHTVTRGIVSALKRTVEVTDSQKYYDLIQTDASINPGNSGGPLLNVDGEMVGINVAVRVGAQGIGFAIPADKAMDVAARLMRSERVRSLQTAHGIQGISKVADGRWKFMVKKVAANSAAAKAGIQPGDAICSISGLRIDRQLDIERALLGRTTGDEIELVVARGQVENKARLVLGNGPRVASRLPPQREPSTPPAENTVWSAMGMSLTPVTPEDLRHSDGKYKGGLRVETVARDSLAARHGIETGDILVGVHRWETASFEDLDYILHRSTLDEGQAVRFYVVRGTVTHEGNMPLVR